MTLVPDQIQTIGSGDTATTVSLLEQSGSTFVVYDGTSIERVRDSERTQQQSASQGGLELSTNSGGQYVVNGQTFAPSSPITLSKEGGPVTYRMFISDSMTYVAIGTSTTVALAEGKPTHATSNVYTEFEFTRASNGDFVLHGTSLSPGEPITVGIGASKTTLRIITISSTPAIVIDGSHTRFLGHNTVNSMSKFSAPPATAAPSATAPPATMNHHGDPVSTGSRSGSWKPTARSLNVAFCTSILAAYLSWG